MHQGEHEINSLSMFKVAAGYCKDRNVVHKKYCRRYRSRVVCMNLLTGRRQSDARRKRTQRTPLLVSFLHDGDCWYFDPSPFISGPGRHSFASLQRTNEGASERWRWQAAAGAGAGAAAMDDSSGCFSRARGWQPREASKQHGLIQPKVRTYIYVHVGV